MKTHLIKKWTIEKYARSHAGSRNAFRFWLLIVKDADWEHPKDIVNTFNSGYTR